MLKAILFDLDGTLLPLDTDKFVQDYLKVLAPKVQEQMDPAFFTKALWKATHAMMENVDPTKRNDEVFESAFLQITGVKKEDIWPIFDQFYSEEFANLAYLSEKSPFAIQIVEEAIAQGYKVVIATNPVFPKVAIEHRLKWAGIDQLPFDLVTVYEECNFTKPHKQYYQMICERLQLSANECLMVGNDVQEDLAAGQLGMKTFLVQGYVIDRGEPAYTADEQGTLAELYHKLKNKEGLFASNLSTNEIKS